MDYRDYLAIRKAYNTVRQGEGRAERLIFEEMAILAKLLLAEEPMMTSAIAHWQKSLRPTMTHRANHLFELGLIDRHESDVDKRSILCSLSKKGEKRLQDLLESIRAEIHRSDRLTRITSDRLIRYIEAMGALCLDSSELVLVGAFEQGGSATISKLVHKLGLLQPTVSMSVSSLVEQGLIRRGAAGTAAHAHPLVELTAEGQSAAARIIDSIESAEVHRRSRLA